MRGEETKELTSVVEELIEILHLQSKELEKLITHIEQVTTRLSYANEIPAVSSGLSKLHLQIKDLMQRQNPGGVASS
jgi:hypothetical protein